jgi:hypothetical protein
MRHTGNVSRDGVVESAAGTHAIDRKFRPVIVIHSSAELLTQFRARRSRKCVTNASHRRTLVQPAPSAALAQ